MEPESLGPLLIGLGNKPEIIGSAKPAWGHRSSLRDQSCCCSDADAGWSPLKVWAGIYSSCPQDHKITLVLGEKVLAMRTWSARGGERRVLKYFVSNHHL